VAIISNIAPATEPKVNNYRFDFDCKLLLGTEYDILTLQQRLNIDIYQPAIDVWRKLRRLQEKKICMELRTSFNLECLSDGVYPDWSVGYNPPLNLITSTRAKDAVINFREDQAKKSILLANDLQQVESARLTKEIDVNMTALKAHYDQDGAESYSLQNAINGLGTFMERAKEKEQAILQERWDEMSSNPRKHLLANLAAKPSVSTSGTVGRRSAQFVQDELNREDPNFRYPPGRSNRGQSRRGRNRTQTRGRGFIPAQQRGRGPQPGRGQGYRGGNNRGLVNNNKKKEEFKKSMKSMMDYIIQNM
jgi:hypothetical protein